MGFQKEKDNGISIITVKLKRATIHDAQEFKKLLVSLIENGEKEIIVDMHECEYIDSTFLGVLITSLKKINTAGGEIVLVGFRSSAHSVIDITGSSRIFKIYPSVKQALNSIKSAA